MKIRIFALAKELDIDSKLLIDYCSKAGITIKNSALASISPEEKDRVLDVMRSAGASGVSAPAAATAVAPAAAKVPVAAAVATPVRDPVADMALKPPRPIRMMGAKPPLMVPRSRVSEAEPAKPVVEDVPPVRRACARRLGGRSPDSSGDRSSGDA